MRRELERLGHRFMSNCDFELLAVYTANNLQQGATWRIRSASIKDIDGVFTYLVATAYELGMAKDTMAAKPMVLYEGEISSRLPRRRSRSAPLFRTRSTLRIRMTRRCAYGSADRSTPSEQER